MYTDRQTDKLTECFYGLHVAAKNNGGGMFWMHNIYPWEYFLYGRKLFFRNENFILRTQMLAAILYLMGGGKGNFFTGKPWLEVGYIT